MWRRGGGGGGGGGGIANAVRDSRSVGMFVRRPFDFSSAAREGGEEGARTGAGAFSEGAGGGPN